MYNWQQIVLGATLVLVVLFIFWQLHIITPIRWARFFFRKYVYGQQDEKESASYVKKLAGGSIYWGFNRERRHEHILFNGSVGKPSWQIQNFGVRFALWGARPKWMYNKEKVLKDLPTSVIRSRSEAELGGKLSSTHPMRAELENEMRESVRNQIELARGAAHGFYRVQAIKLLRGSLTARSWQNEDSFAGWIAKRGMLLGVQECYEIGTSVCTEMNFTLAEAQNLYDELKKEVELVEV